MTALADSVIEIANEYIAMAKKNGVQGVYERTAGEAAYVRLRVAKGLRELPPNVAFPKSRRRTRWNLPRSEKHDLILQADREGVSYSAIAVGAGCSESLVRSLVRSSQREQELALQEILDEALKIQTNQRDIAATAWTYPEFVDYIVDALRQLLALLRGDRGDKE